MQIILSRIETANYLCRSCGTCCKADIPIHAPEVMKLSELTGLKIREIVEDDGYKNHTLQMRLKNDETCIFLKDSRCQIYGDRPLICYKFPLQFALAPDGQDIKAVPWWTGLKDADSCVGLPERYETGVNNIALQPEQILAILEKGIKLRATRAQVSRKNGVDRFVRESFEFFSSLTLEEATKILFQNQGKGFLII